MNAAAVQVFFPLFGESNQKRRLGSLVIDLAARYEEKSPEGTVSSVMSTIAPTTRTEKIAYVSEGKYVFTPEIGVSGDLNRTCGFERRSRVRFCGPISISCFDASYRRVSVILFPSAPLPAGSFVTQTSGGSVDLEEQESTTATFGIDYSPSAVSELSSRLTWSTAKIENVISTIDAFTSIFSVINFPGQYPE